MPTEKQKTARKLAGQRLQGYWDRVNEKTAEQKIKDVNHCMWGLVIVTILLSGIEIYKLFR